MGSHGSPTIADQPSPILRPFLGLGSSKNPLTSLGRIDILQATAHAESLCRGPVSHAAARDLLGLLAQPYSFLVETRIPSRKGDESG